MLSGKDQKSIRVKLGLPADALIVGMVARLQRWKGIHLVVESFARLKTEFPSAILVVVGGRHALEPDYEGFLQKQVAALNLEDRVVFPGFQSNVPEWLAAMDIVVNASADEPFGMSLVEAMAAERSVIAIKSAGPAEIVTDGVEGVLVDCCTPEAISGALGRLMRTSVLGCGRGKMPEAARKISAWTDWSAMSRRRRRKFLLPLRRNRDRTFGRKTDSATP